MKKRRPSKRQSARIAPPHSPGAPADNEAGGSAEVRFKQLMSRMTLWRFSAQ